MEAPSPMAARVSMPCSHCRAAVSVGETRCSKCGFALTPDEARALQERWEANDPEAAERTTAVGTGRVILALVAGLNLVSGITTWLIFDLSNAWAQLVRAVLFAALLATSFRKPFSSIVAALSLDIVLWVAMSLLDPANIFAALWLRGLTIFGLLGACGAVLRSRRALRDARGSRAS